MPTLTQQDMKDLAIAVFATFLGVFATQGGGGDGGSSAGTDSDQYLTNELFKSLVVALERKGATDVQLHQLVSKVNDNINNMVPLTDALYEKWRRQLISTFDSIDSKTSDQIINKYKGFTDAEKIQPDVVPKDELLPAYTQALKNKYTPITDAEREAQLSIQTVLHGDGIETARILIAPDNLTLIQKFKPHLQIPFAAGKIFLVYRPAITTTDVFTPAIVMQNNNTPQAMSHPPQQPTNKITDTQDLLLPDIYYTTLQVNPAHANTNPNIMFCTQGTADDCALKLAQSGQKVKINTGKFFDSTGSIGYCFFSMEAAKYLDAMLLHT